jgi:hypothetical protein
MSDTVTVILDSDPDSGYWYYAPGASGGLRNGRGIACEIPREQYDRWRATEDAYFAMQDEIGAYIQAAPQCLPGHTSAKFVLVGVRESGEPSATSGLGIVTEATAAPRVGAVTDPDACTVTPLSRTGFVAVGAVADPMTLPRLSTGVNAGLGMGCHTLLGAGTGDVSQVTGVD